MGLPKNSSKVLVAVAAIAATLFVLRGQKTESHSTIRERAPASAPTATVKVPSAGGAATRLPPSSKTPGPATADSVVARNELEKDSLKAQIYAEKNCYVTEACDFPQTDPHSYSFALSRKIATDLSEFKKKYAKQFSKDAQKLANEFLSNEDGFVQAAALELLRDLPTGSESLRAVASAVNATTDPGIVEQAMAELRRYLGTSEEAEVHRALGELLATGGILTSQQASRGVLPFLNAKSVSFYEKLAAGLPSGSEVARNLRLSLAEFHRKNGGG